MDIRLASTNELPILESLARQIWPQAYANIISPAQIEFMLNWMYSAETLQKQQTVGHEFYILASDGQDIGFMALEWVNGAHAVFKRQLKITCQSHWMIVRLSHWDHLEIQNDSCCCDRLSWSDG
jgi:hypothetical protein